MHRFETLLTDEPVSHDVKAFMRLWSESAPRIRGYIYTLLGSGSDVDDLLQQVSLIAWQKFGQYEPNTDFFRWSSRIAHLEVLQYFRKQRRVALPSQELMDSITAETELMLLQLNLQSEALGDCLKKLKSQDQELVYLRYHDDMPILEIATQIGRTGSAVYKAFHRIHEQLYQCVKRYLGGQGQR